jgi:hypothetical protein
MTFKVTVDAPDDVTQGEMAEFIRTEIEAGGGNRDPNDPLFRKKNPKISHVSTKP